jgi:tetratricopeptide (TPR) repeat protein
LLRIFDFENAENAVKRRTHANFWRTFENEKLIFFAAQKFPNMDEKEKGNELFRIGDYVNALKCYQSALVVCPDNHILYSNQAICYYNLNDYEKAKDNITKCKSLSPQWQKVSAHFWKNEN